MTISQINKLKGPIVVFGAGGFVGVNLIKAILAQRDDVIGFSHKPESNWRLKQAKVPTENICKCDILKQSDIKTVIKKYKPQTIFNLAAYGAYSWQHNTEKIYLTNFVSTVSILEILKKTGFSIYVHAGSQSEYGLNCTAPSEEDELVPNSDYAVSKTAVYYYLKFLGKVEKLPVVHLRLYSVYGPYEEPGRLIISLIKSAKKGKFPPLADKNISHDFIYVDDVVEAFLTVSANAKTKHYGSVYNIATGKMTTLETVAEKVGKVFKILDKPNFSSYPGREWDLKNWYGNPKKMYQDFGWKARVGLAEGLRMTAKQIENNGS